MNFQDIDFYGQANAAANTHTYHYNQAGNNTLMTITQWTEAIGTTLSAIASTPISFISTDTLANLNIIGDVIQVGSTAIQIDAEKKITFNSIGNYVQVAGNVEEIGAEIILYNDQTAQTPFITQGNAIQAVGVSLSLVFFLGQKHNLINVYNIYANILQVIGLSIQVLSSNSSLTTDQSNTLNAIGGWLQAIGTILAAIAQSLD
ncbi:MAG: DUF6944 family repetitive protein [Bacillus sp. (in: firmicutes)]